MNVIFIFCMIFGVCLSTNLISQGDFQFFSNLSFTNIQRTNANNASVSSNFWYVQNLQNKSIELKYFDDPTTTITAELTTSQKITLCQNISLMVSTKYKIYFTMFNQMFSNMTGFVYINGQIVSSLLIKNPNNFNDSSYTFYAQSQHNKVCFNQSHHDNSSLYQYQGGLLDNVSLILVQQQVITLDVFIDQLAQSIRLETNFTFNALIAEHFQNNLQFELQSYPLNFTTSQSDNGNLVFQAQIQFNFRMDTFVAVYNSQSNETSYKFVFNQNLTGKWYYNLQNLQLNVLSVPKKFINLISLGLGKLLVWSRVYFFSYFIAIVVDNQYLAFFYVFLQPKTMPDFCKNLYYSTLEVLLGGQNQLDYTFELLNLSPLGNIQSISEKVEEIKNEEPWFGYFQFSSRIVDNNVSNLYSLLLLVAKTLLVRFIIKCCVPQYVKRVLDRQPTKLWILLLTEFCFMAPSIIPGVLMNVLVPATDYYEWMYKMLNVCLLFFIIVCFIVFIYKTTERIPLPMPKKKPQPPPKEETKQKKGAKPKEEPKPKRRYMYKFQEDIIVFPKLLFIPFAIAGSSALFLGFISLVIVSEIIILKYLLSKDMSRMKIIIYIAGIVAWSLHHICFIVLQLQVQSIGLGFLPLYTAMFIILVEILKLLYKIYDACGDARDFRRKVKKQKQYMIMKNQGEQEELNMENIEEQIKEMQEAIEYIKSQQDRYKRVKEKHRVVREMVTFRKEKQKQLGEKIKKAQKKKEKQKQKDEQIKTKTKNREEEPKHMIKMIQVAQIIPEPKLKEEVVQKPTFGQRFSNCFGHFRKPNKITHKVTVQQIKEPPQEMQEVDQTPITWRTKHIMDMKAKYYDS